MYNRFAESSRLNYLRGFALASDEEHRQFWLELITPRSIGWILKSIRTEYKCVSLLNGSYRSCFVRYFVN